jgi:hypothetical protein
MVAVVPADPAVEAEASRRIDARHECCGWCGAARRGAMRCGAARARW